ncbi:hypothetical protein CBR_g4081 [Chara braunii]|uniref:Uncharacterized protein n=1 Tax=Chara braunii TaxID=69332 RepID=A0A388KHA1_CHABU|nr:hypothetical protein CBR_g4081 [Chara braunii]|eukprot:GBG69388.1 hypothetical protein CBR_g4081 [Chara braunii]
MCHVFNTSRDPSTQESFWVVGIRRVKHDDAPKEAVVVFETTIPMDVAVFDFFDRNKIQGHKAVTRKDENHETMTEPKSVMSGVALGQSSRSLGWISVRPTMSGETDEAYQARKLVMITEAKQWSDAVAAATKKKAEDVEKVRLLAIEQQRQQDEAAAKAADEERLQRREKIFSGERALLTLAADWRAEAGNDNLEESGNKIALLLSHLTDLLTTCIAQQEDIHNLYSAVQTHNQGFDKRTSRLQQLEQTVAAPVASSSNTSDRLEALELDVGSLKDGVQLQQTATQQLEQRICTAANHSSSKPREIAPNFDGQEIFCNSTKTDPQVWTHTAATLLDLHTKISWDDLKAAWHKRSQVEPSEIKAMDKLMVFEQGTLPSVDWIAEYQRLTSVSDIQMGFKAIQHYFISRACSALGNALTHVEDTLTTPT